MTNHSREKFIHALSPCSSVNQQAYAMDMLANYVVYIYKKLTARKTLDRKCYDISDNDFGKKRRV